MILLFGGTTEGRRAAAELEDAGSAFYYSTKSGEQDVPLHHGVAVAGAMKRDAMAAFCREHGIRLIVDAAHPFAKHLHHTVADVAGELGVPVIRFERIYPKRYDERIKWCCSYNDFVSQMERQRPCTVLSTAGVQSIEKLKSLKDKGFCLRYRILHRNSSIAVAHGQGAGDGEFCYYGDESDAALFHRMKPDVVLVKDSGEAGGFDDKVKAALSEGIAVYALRRPATPASFHQVNGPHGLRRMVERLLPGFYALRSGLTTGTYATAVAVAATCRLLRGETPDVVDVVLPDGESIGVPVAYTADHACAMKDSGDDPDVTDGLEIRASVDFGAEGDPPITVLGGEGVGRITLPGFDYPPGEAAINKVPREMISRNILDRFSPQRPLRVTVSVPDGAAVASRTFNPRLGIVGGISIVGVSGIIKPFSDESFVASIRKCMEVAKASGSSTVVINSGAKSERFVRSRFPELPPQAFVEYGNFIGDTIKLAADVGFRRLTLGVMLGKAVKLAAGNLDTHSRRSVMDKTLIAQMLVSAGCSANDVDRACGITLARELWHIVPPERLQAFVNELIQRCLHWCRPLFPGGELEILLIDDDGNIFSFSPCPS